MTREEMQGFFLNVLVGLGSVAVPSEVSGRPLGKLVYLLVFPLQNDQRPRGLPQGRRARPGTQARGEDADSEET